MSKLTVLFVVCFSLFGFSQDVLVKKSDIFVDSKKNSTLKFSLEDNAGGLVTIRAFYNGLGKEKGYYIQHFDSELNLLNGLEYSINKGFISEAFFSENKLCLIGYEESKKEKKISLTVVFLDLKTLEFSSKTILSFSQNEQKQYFGDVFYPIYIQSGKATKLIRKHTIKARMSKHNNHFVFDVDVNLNELKTKKIFVFNRNFDLIYNYSIPNDFETTTMEIDDESGAIYFMQKIYEPKRDKEKGKPNYHFEIIVLDKQKQSKISFNNPEKFISSIKMFKTNDGFICVGFYGNQKEFRINGVSYFKINAETFTIESEKFLPFSKEFLNDRYGNNESAKDKRAEKGIGNLIFRSIHFVNDRDFIINAEEHYVTTSVIMDPNGGMYTNYTPHYDDVISIKLDIEGNLKWARNINKSQIGNDTSSFTSISVEDDVFIFINCSDKIKKLNDNRISFSGSSAKKSNLYMIKINREGDFDFKKILDNEESEVYYMVNNGIVNLEERTVILRGKRKKKSRILKIKI